MRHIPPLIWSNFVLPNQSDLRILGRISIFAMLECSTKNTYIRTYQNQQHHKAAYTVLLKRKGAIAPTNQSNTGTGTSCQESTTVRVCKPPLRVTFSFVFVETLDGAAPLTLAHLTFPACTVWAARAAWRPTAVYKVGTAYACFRLILTGLSTERQQIEEQDSLIWGYSLFVRGYFRIIIIDTRMCTLRNA